MEIYPAIQGEGTKTGELSVFIRLFGCNLRCSWCDTPYSINRKEAERALSPDEMSNLYRRFTPFALSQQVLADFPSIWRIVITGGEPTIHLPLILELGGLFHNAGRHITVETNGTIPPATEDFQNVDLWSVSAKLEGSQISTVPADARIVDFGAWAKFVGFSQFKFVITEPDRDLAEVRQILVDNPLMRFSPIILTPNGDLFFQNPAQYWDLYQTISTLTSGPEWDEFALSLKVLPQLHILFSGRKRFT